MSKEVIELDLDEDEKEAEKLTSIEERQVDFYGDVITAALVQVQGGRPQIYVPLRPLCEHLRLQCSAQLKFTKRDEVLAESLISVSIMDAEAVEVVVRW